MTSRSDRTSWYLDSSVGVRILLGGDVTTARWYDTRRSEGQQFLSSVLLRLEVVRVLRREGMNPLLADELTGEITLLSIDDGLTGEAGSIRAHVRSLDSLHLASALRNGVERTTIVTHDKAMRAAALTLGFAVYDPVTD